MQVLQEELKNCFLLHSSQPHPPTKKKKKIQINVDFFFLYGIYRNTGVKGCTPRMYVKRFSGNLPCVSHWRRVSLESKIMLLQNRRLLFYMLLIPLARKSNMTVLASYQISVRWFKSISSLKLVSVTCGFSFNFLFS